MKNTLVVKNSSKTFLLIYVLSLSIIIPLSSILNPVLLGEDEALTFIASTNILNHILNFKLVNLISEIIKDWHPPGRNLLPLWCMKIFGSSMTTIRLPYYFFWIITCVLGVLITRKFTHNIYAYICATLLAGSGLFHLQIMALSHGMVSFFGMLIIYLLVKDKNFLSENFSIKKFLILSMILYAGFLFFNTLILLTVMLHLIQFFLIIKTNNFMKPLINFCVVSIFIFIFYLIYYLIFIGVPMLMVNNESFILFLKNVWGITDFGNWDGDKFGQYHQYSIRSESSKINLSSLISNISYLNWHFFPMLSLFIITGSILMLKSNFKKILFLILPYFIVTNFFMSGNTGQHFASVFIWLIPFFCIYLSKLFKNIYFIKMFNILIIVMMIPYTVWAHIVPYNEMNYPHRLVNKVYGSEKWPPNLVRPLDLISVKIKKNVSIKDNIAYTLDGAVALYYLRDYQAFKINDLDKLSRNEYSCKILSKKYKAIITNDYISKHCSKYIKNKYTFNNSNIKVYIFK